MTQSEVPLYPKISSIYNKILQLAIAIVFIVILMYSSVEQVIKDTQQVERFFTQYGKDYIFQAARSTELIIVDGDREQLKQHIENLSEPEFIDNVYLYDESGQMIFSSGDLASINELYGIALNTEAANEQLIPFVSELRTDKLLGYLRLTIKQQAIVDELQQANLENQDSLRMLLIMAGTAGFFLTRGLSRFSRRGYRFNIKS